MGDEAAINDDFERRAIAQSHLGRAHHKWRVTEWQQNFESAISTLQHLIEFDDGTPRLHDARAGIHYRYGLALHERGDPQAKDQFQLARDTWMGIKEEQNSEYLWELAWLLATCPEQTIRDVETANQYAKRAVEIASDNCRYLTTLALTSLLRGDSAQCVTLLDRSRSVRGEWNDFDFFVLAMALSEQGRADKAKEAFDNGDSWMKKNRPRNLEMLLIREMAEAHVY